jgi:hypothetical protein
LPPHHRLRRLSLLALITLGFFLSTAPAQADAPFDPGTVPYQVSFNGKTISWREFAFFVPPASERELKLSGLPSGTRTRVSTSTGAIEQVSAGHWHWQAPEQPGLVRIEIQPDGQPSVVLHVITLVPASEIRDGYLNGYRIGAYPDEPLNGNSIYLPPPGFIEVTPELAKLPVSPHFTLGQFLCKQQADHWPKYLVLREALVAKLEIILAEVNQRGIRTDTFHVMSGYRTPWYNQTIGNGRYSRHVWGGAADIFVDTNGNGRMDDLTGDGRSDLKDAQVLLDIIEEIYQTREHRRLHGGLGLYGPRPHRGPFVHVDARGFEARWILP